MTRVERITDKGVLLVIAVGLIAILLAIIAGLFGWFESKTTAPLPNWAEYVLVAIATATVLKLGDCLSTLIALAQGRQVGDMGTKLAASAPIPGADPGPGLNGEGRPTGTEDDPVHTTEEPPQ
jgi:cobalamin biosynthesis protein CobD/CbiB